ncbi:MAG: glucosamine-6-phosphate deaminase [Gemmatimonas sp.]|nr:glucosamine-6-phosphate deaminase [Gemmatimonas sp.]
MTSGLRHDAADASKARDTAPAAQRGPSHVSGALTALERIPTVVLDDHQAVAVEVAQRIAGIIRSREAEGRATVLGLATGSTPIGVYRELIRMHREEGLSFKRVVSFNLDEYYPMAPDNIHSYHRFMWENLFSQVDVDPANVHIPDGTVPREKLDSWCAAYEQAIRDQGGVDIQILGIGKTGHIGFNEPGSGETSRTRLVHLDTVTRRDAAADFFGEEFVPREAVTMGVATILDAREIVILATGEHKARIVRRAVEGPVALEVAATFLQRHPATTFFVDAAAAVELTRVATPWLLDEVEWTERRTLDAVTWLSRKVGRAILKLTQGDYAEHQLSSLVARHGSPGAVNGLVFNLLGAKIRGKSKLPHGKKVVCFSPHPDDDVISMGGILRKLTENGNQIIVAYMTSGNIAVFDHDVRRHVDFLHRMQTGHGLGDAQVPAFVAKVDAFLQSKQPGDVDIPEVADIKRIIREAEAISGLETVGLTGANGRFLNLPFYQTGKVKKDPIGPADVAIVRALLAEAKPDYIFVAGDLSDPHGTHRMCKEAIDAAIDELWPNRPRGPRPVEARRAGEDTPAQAPEVWLYRGAWQEWPITEATWLVPMSQEELRFKIQAIFKHQSQKDSMPFPGQDEREFWQRVEQRNKETAGILDQLGLAEYFAMEAYVVD